MAISRSLPNMATGVEVLGSVGAAMMGVWVVIYDGKSSNGGKQAGLAARADVE